MQQAEKVPSSAPLLAERVPEPDSVQPAALVLVACLTCPSDRCGKPVHTEGRCGHAVPGHNRTADHVAALQRLVPGFLGHATEVLGHHSAAEQTHLVQGAAGIVGHIAALADGIHSVAAGILGSCFVHSEPAEDLSVALDIRSLVGVVGGNLGRSAAHAQSHSAFHHLHGPDRSHRSYLVRTHRSHHTAAAHILDRIRADIHYRIVAAEAACTASAQEPAAAVGHSTLASVAHR